MAKKNTSPRKSPLGQFVETPISASEKASEPSAKSVNAPLSSPTHRNTLRRELLDMVSRDILGPSKPDEELPMGEKPGGRYLVGLLAPQNVGVLASELDTVADAVPESPEEGPTEAEGAGIDSMFPSAMGMTFVVDESATALVIKVSYGRYEPKESAIQTTKAGNPARTWHRVPVEATSSPIPLKAGNLPKWRPEPDRAIEVAGRVRERNGQRIVTVFLANRQQEQRPRDLWWVFQPRLVVASEDGSPIFTKRYKPNHDASKLDPLHAKEQKTLSMLYRRRLEFAVGHGVSVHATKSAIDSTRATQIETRYMPEALVKQVTPPEPDDNPDLAGCEFDMKALATISGPVLQRHLGFLADAYEAWIGREEAKISQPEENLCDHEEAAKDAIVGCKKTLERLRAGIDLLKTNDQALEAFRFANRAMASQRVHGIYARQVRKGVGKGESALGNLDIGRNRSWRAFQLAFVLINLPSLTDLHHPERSSEQEALADLLWFPTGGGKTEAYLGLTAYVLALRRLQGVIEGHSGEHGLAVLMRYTLRLLTLQQFQRAATLMCACEEIRKTNDAKWGKTPFRIGLYVGAKTTPNSTNAADEAIRMGGGGGWGTPAQLTSCPWCGSAITNDQHIKVYKAPSDVGRTILYCGDPLGQCPFTERKANREGLPVMVVDEEIYRNPPAVLVATVDKFAQLPWKGELQMLFGKVNGWCSRHGFLSPEVDDRANHLANRQAGLPASKVENHSPLRPPDLIIQDELHLISGPLGSMVGLYEAAIDELSTWTVEGKKVKPKIIASTATVRRAEEQVKRLFVRKLAVFPPHGLDVRDNFFSLQQEPGLEHPGRLYIGVCAFGKKFKQALIRVYTALLAAGQKLYETHDQQADPWMTLVGYFNSLRELGGMKRLVDDDVANRLQRMDERGLARRSKPGVDELTSRRSGTDIPRILDRLEIPFRLVDDKSRAEARKAHRNGPEKPLDVVLATNMISVGVDVERLGLMVTAGQPKTTAEYIQATSRVGRASPGLVVDVYNWARPRDLSHYEMFEHYHETFYQHVEALSLTPFATRALERGLSGVYVGLIRQAEASLNPNEAAGSIKGTEALLTRVAGILQERGMQAMIETSVGDEIKQMTDRRRDKWVKRAATAKDHRVGYEDDGQGVVGLLQHAGQTPQWQEFSCLDSLRDVEPMVNLVLDERSVGLNPFEPVPTEDELNQEAEVKEATA
jgi:hypothetical protein